MLPTLKTKFFYYQTNLICTHVKERKKKTEENEKVYRCQQSFPKTIPERYNYCLNKTQKRP